MTSRIFLHSIVSLLVGSALCAAAFVGCSSSPIVESGRQVAPLPIDGNASDWKRPLDYYDKKTKLSFSISNDSATLYLCLQAADQELQTKIVRGGLQIWLDTNGGSAKSVGVMYPVPSTFSHMGSDYGNGNSMNPHGVNSNGDDFDPIGALRRSFYRSNADRIQITGFHAPAAGLVPISNSFGIQIRIGWDTTNNMLNYEAAIPFAAFYKALVRSADSARAIGVTFTVNGVGVPHKESADRAADDNSGGAQDSYPGAGTMGGMGAGGMGDGGMGTPGGMPGGVPGAMPGGGMGHGRHGGGKGTDSNPLSEPESLSFRLKLATTH